MWRDVRPAKRMLRTDGLRRVGLSTRATLLFVAYALQNIEETLFLPGWLTAQRPDYVWPGPAQYGVAAMLLTLAAAVIVILSGQRRHAGFWGSALACLAGALLLNAVAKLLLSVGMLSLMPGAVSGVLGVAPAALWVLAGLVQTRRLTARGAAIASVLGVALTPFASGAALRAAAWLLT